MKVSLRIKLILSYLVISLFLVISLLFFARFAINKVFANYVKENFERRSSEIAGQVSTIYRENDRQQAFQLYRQLGEYAVTMGLVLRVEDSRGNLVWCMDCEAPEMCMNMLSGMEYNMNRIYQGFPGAYTENTYPVEQDGNQVGTVVLGYYGPFYYDDIDMQFLAMLNRIFAVAAVGALAASVLLGLFMAGRISSPIKKVTRQTKQIEQGDYGVLSGERSSTLEMDQLIGSVNKLAVTLGRQKELRKRLAQDYAHEFRTPLASLQSNIEAMVDGIWEPTRERLLSLEEELQRLTRMVGGLDELVEVEDNLVLNRTTFDLYEFIQQSLIKFESDIHNKQLRAVISGEHVLISADKDKIGQVIVNLLSNAIKYSKDGTEIGIRVTQTDKSCGIEVCDEGIGIAKEDIPSIFEHLYRADKSRASETGGSGIGLAVVKAIVEAHGGTITAESEEGSGSTFFVEIPK